MKRALLLATLLAGCSFPEPTIVDELANETASDGSVAETMADTAATDAKVNLCETLEPCDCDGDGDKDKRSGCGGNDCDDGDPRRSSLVTSFLGHSVDGTGHSGDWDCSMTVTKEYAEDIKCVTYLATTGCSQQGYKGTPACGTMATFVRCKAGTINCAEDTTSSIIVKCK